MQKIFVLFEEEFSPQLRAFLEASIYLGQYSFEVHRSLDTLASLSLRRHAALCLYVNFGAIPDDLYSRLTGFIHDGGGLLALHVTSNAFRNQPSFEGLLGARFLRHGKIKPYGIEPAVPGDPLAAGISGFVVEDELYRQRYSGAITVHFVNRNRRIVEPLVWSKTFGKGTIVGISPGHRAETVSDPNYARLAESALKFILRSQPESPVLP